MERLSYHPQLDMQQLYAFDERLRNIPGSWNTIGRSFVHAGAPDVIHLRWLINDQPWCTERGFLDFLDVRSHRLLLNCFLQKKPVEKRQNANPKATTAGKKLAQHGRQHAWKEKALCESIGLAATQHDQLTEALHFLELQEYIELKHPHEWMSSSLLEHIANFDATFSWCVQAHLQNHRALTRRCVSFKEWQSLHLNDLDILAFTDDGLIMTVACISERDLPSGFLQNFVQRARIFPADIVLLLVDTESESLLTHRLQQINTMLKREASTCEQRYLQDSSIIYHVTKNIYIANTAGGIDPTLTAILRLGSSIKQEI
jgi:hypothetical protein